MFRTLCNQLCITFNEVTRKVMEQVARVAASKAGLAVVDADAVLMPQGCRPIPKHYYDVDPAVLNQLKDGNRAILHQAMKNWQVSNEQTGKHWFMKNDQWGTLSDPKLWHKQIFPFLTLKTVKVMIADLAEASLLVVDGAWCQPLKAEFSGAEQLALDLGKDFQQPRKVFPSSIESKGNSSKSKTRKSKPISTRKDAVADFNLPNPEKQADFETHESRSDDVEGEDVLHRLPGQLVSEWRDGHMTLAEYADIHGVDRICAAWENAKDFKNRIKGTRFLLGQAPTPPVPPPPSSPAAVEESAGSYQEGDHPLWKLMDGPDDDTQEDLTAAEDLADETPAIDEPIVVDPNSKAWGLAYSQLALQLDANSFHTWVRGAAFLRLEDGVWVIGVANKFAQDQLEHRLYREVRRVLGDVLGNRVELRFEVMGAKHHDAAH